MTAFFFKSRGKDVVSISFFSVDCHFDPPLADVNPIWDKA